MTNDPVDLDARRSAADKIATDIRRQFEAAREALRRRQEELEAQRPPKPAESWTEADAKAQYLIRLGATTVDAQEARRRKFLEWTSAISLA